MSNERVDSNENSDDDSENEGNAKVTLTVPKTQRNSDSASIKQEFDSISQTIDDDEFVTLSIHQAAREGAIEKIKNELRDNGTNIKTIIDQLNRENQAPIHLAARYNRYDFIDFLVKEGADINLAGEDGNTALHIAIK